MSEKEPKTTRLPAANAEGALTCDGRVENGTLTEDMREEPGLRKIDFARRDGKGADATAILPIAPLEIKTLKISVN